MNKIWTILKVIRGIIMVKVYGDVKDVIKGLEEIARDLPEVVIKSDGDYQARKLRELVSMLKALYGIDDDPPDSKTEVHGGGTGDD